LSSDEHYIIDTPENIEFSYNVAGIGSRFLAAIVDTLILMVVQVVLTTVMMTLLSAVEDAFGNALSSILLAVWILLTFVFLWGYYLFFELAWNGQSPGKRAVRLRVVREGGRPTTFVSSAIRNLIRFIDFLPGFYGLGVLVMFIDPRARRLGDLAGGTLVVKERQAVSLESLSSRAEPLPMQQPAASAGQSLPNLHLISNHDYDLVQDFLRRRQELGRESRMRLGVQLANTLHTRLGLQTSGGDHEKFLEQVASDYRAEQARRSRERVEGSGVEGLQV
jgi:uncharacterized RDD family membrane protein YckC